MLKRTLLCSIFIFLIIASCRDLASACDAHGSALARSGRSSHDSAEGSQRPWSFDFTVEQQNWKEIPARDAHRLHHQGHHVHDKSHEEFYHLGVGRRLGEHWAIRAEVPYVVRHSIEIDDHDRLGEREVSEGLGDIKLSSSWSVAADSAGFVGVLGGVKLPTGFTTVKNSQDVRFEPELQPGSGSDDYFGGIMYGVTVSGVTMEGNVLQTWRTEGDQRFRYGDLFSVYTTLSVPLNGKNADWRVDAGADLNLQVEQRHREEGVLGADSGGTTFLTGPVVSIRSKSGFELFGNFLLPAVQNLGGEHQKLDFVWNAGGKLNW